MKKVKQWGKKSHKEAEPKEEAKQRQPPLEQKPVVAGKAAIKLYSRSRTELACKVFSDVGSKEAGILMAKEIGQRGLLRGKGSKTRFVSNREGYTAEQIEVLLNEFVYKS